MTNEELAQQIASLLRSVQALDERIDGLAARIEYMQIHALREPVYQEPPRLPTTEEVWATPPRPRFRFLNGSWPVRDGNTYPRIQNKGPLDGYESYVRRSPPATE